MELARFEPDVTWSEFVVVRLLRRWAAAREAELNPLPSVVELAAELGQETQVAVTLHSVFQLAESCLARRLQVECCCSHSLSADERAILTLIAVASIHGPMLTDRRVPHGLPGALCWAAASARLALRFCPRLIGNERRVCCPFEPQRSQSLG